MLWRTVGMKAGPSRNVTRTRAEGPNPTGKSLDCGPWRPTLCALSRTTPRSADGYPGYDLVLPAGRPRLRLRHLHPRARALPLRQVGRRAGRPLLHRLRPGDLSQADRRDRIRPVAAAPGRLREDARPGGHP